MSAYMPKKILSDELDALLKRAAVAEEEWQQARREAGRLEQGMNELNVECQRLRMALFALAGQSGKSGGDANKANFERALELKKATS